MSEVQTQDFDQEVQDAELEIQEQDLDEAKKASMGDPSEIPDPVAKDAKAPGGDGKKVDPKKGMAQGSSNIKVPGTKVGMINAMVDAMKGKSKAQIKSSYGKVMAMYGEDVEIDETDLVTSIKEIQQITAEDLNVSEDISAIFGGQDLSEEFVSKATTVFEAAVVSKVNEILENVTVDMEAELEAEKEDIVESMSQKLDDYLEYVAEEWMKENELAVEQGIRAEIVENFMVGLRNLFTENYIDIPEEKVDLVDELATKVEELETEVNEQMERNIQLKKQLEESTASSVFDDVIEGLTESQAEKLKSLSEGVEFSTAEDYKEKLETIKESYFSVEEEVSNVDNAVDDEPVEIFEDGQSDAVAIDPGMRQYMDAISRSIKK
jgi:hypothetical protein